MEDFFGGIFLEDFFGGFFGGFFWEDILSRFLQEIDVFVKIFVIILSQWKDFRSLEVRRKLIALKN